MSISLMQFTSLKVSFFNSNLRHVTKCSRSEFLLQTGDFLLKIWFTHSCLAR